MSAALAVHEFEATGRPGWFERILVLGVCAGMLVGLAILDERAAERETARAHAVIAERTQRAAERASREAMTAPVASSAPRTERLGREAPIVVAAGAVRTGTVVREAEPRRVAAQPSAPVKTVVAAGGSRDNDPLLLMLMAALGLSMAGGGLRLLSRRSA